MEDARIVLTGSCRRCGAAVRASAKPGPVYRCMADCDRCHYRTVLRNDPIDLPLSDALKAIFSTEAMESISGKADVSSAFIAAVRGGFDKVSEFLQEHREVAVAELLELMDLREQDLAQLFTDPRYNEMADTSAPLRAATCQTLYLLLLQHGPIVMPARPVSESMIKIFRHQIYPLLMELVTIVKVVLPGLQDGLGRLNWTDGNIRLDSFEKNTLMMESGINELLEEHRDGLDAPRPHGSDLLGVTVSEPCRRALALATGIDVAFLTEFLEW
jgi:hypothetical protein